MIPTTEPVGLRVLALVRQLVGLLDEAKAAELPVMPVASVGVANVAMAGYVLCQAEGVQAPPMELLAGPSGESMRLAEPEPVRFATPPDGRRIVGELDAVAAMAPPQNRQQRRQAARQRG